MEYEDEDVGLASRPPPEPSPGRGDAATALSVLAAAALAACGGGGGGGTGTGGGPSNAPVVDSGPPPSAAEASRFLAQATLGATRSEIAAVQQLGYGGWLEAQFAMPRSAAHYDWMAEHGFGAEEFRGSTNGLDNSLWNKFITSPDVLRQRMTLALSELLVVSVLGVDTGFRQFAIGHYVDILEAHAFGNYRDLLTEVSLSTAMGYYLTYRGSAKANAQGSQPDENYARELMQLFTIGLTQLEADGTVRAGAPESYAQSDVSGLARVFTGWDLDKSGLVSPYPPDIHRRPMAQVASRYETGAKTFLGVTIPANTAADVGLRTALDTLFNHPNLPPFVSRQLIQRLVTSNPSPAYVGRVAAIFRNNGGGVRGDLQSVLRAILLDPEARFPGPASPTFGKLREPVVRFLNWARAFNAASPSGMWTVGDLSDIATELGQSPMRSPSVFNFFRPGYVPPSTSIAQAGLAAPEMQITTETAVVGYLNFMQRAINGSGVGDVRADYAPLIALAPDSKAVLDELNLVLAANQLSPATLSSYKAALDTINATSDSGKRNRVLAAILLVMGSPEYIVQK